MKTERRHNNLLAYGLVTVILLWFLLVLSGCAPKHSHKHFHQPKYTISDHVRQGRPTVRQTWWKSWWSWKPVHHRKSTPLDP